MSDVSKDDYQAAMNIVMQADKELIVSASAVLKELGAALDAAKAKFDTVKSTIPTVNGPPSVALQNVNNWSSQVQSFDYQIASMLSTVTGLLQQYDPASTSIPLPTMTP